MSGSGGRTMIRCESSDFLISMVGIGPFLLPMGHVLLLGSFPWSLGSPKKGNPPLPSTGLSGFRCEMKRRMLNVGRDNILKPGLREICDD